MGQGICAGEPTQEKGATEVAVAEKVISDIQYSTIIVESGLVDEAAQDNVSLFAFTSLPFQSSNRREVLIRALDIVGSVGILIFAMPVMLVVALLIKIFSPGQILYKQKRVGKNGKIFTLYKFRTMMNNAEESTGPVWAARDDARVTPIGRFLRQTRLDEFPQLLNVLRGDMSLVGPRPERLYFVRQHKALRGIRLAVKPGLTGLAQIRSFYNLKPDHKIKYDYIYIQKRGLLLNLYILLKTVPIIFCKKGW